MENNAIYFEELTDEELDDFIYEGAGTIQTQILEPLEY